MFPRNKEKYWAASCFTRPPSPQKKIPQGWQERGFIEGYWWNQGVWGSQRKGSCSLLSGLTAREVPDLREAWEWDGRWLGHHAFHTQEDKVMPASQRVTFLNMTWIQVEKESCSILRWYGGSKENCGSWSSYLDRKAMWTADWRAIGIMDVSVDIGVESWFQPYICSIPSPQPMSTPQNLDSTEEKGSCSSRFIKFNCYPDHIYVLLFNQVFTLRSLVTILLSLWSFVLFCLVFVAIL